MKNNRKDYNGPERRIRPINDRRCEINCFEHSGLVEKVASIDKKTRRLEKEGFLTISSYRWTTGLLVSILIAVLSATLYSTFQTSEALRAMQASQLTLSVQISYLQDDIEDLKRKVK